MRELLSVADNLERAIEASEKGSEKQLREGVAIIYRQLQDILQKQGLKEIEALGQTFDPHVHEAVSRVETSEHADSTVLEVFQAGYLLGDRLLRPAMVSVARNLESDSETADKAEDIDSEEQKAELSETQE